MKKIYLNKIVSVLLCFFISSSSAQFVFADTVKNVVYTEFSNGNSNHSGDGSESSPYNLFEDALNAVDDGGIIYIGGKGAFVNDTNSDSSPLIINKNVTIMSTSDDSANTIIVRKGGIILGANVTFKNVQLSFANMVHSVICANGYTLTLDNTYYDSLANTVHISAGSFYDLLTGENVASSSGENGNIILKGKSTKFGNIYAGSINGGFDKPVNIVFEDLASKSVGEVYSSGAREGYYEPDQMLNPDYKPEAPAQNPELYPFTSSVNIDVNCSEVSSIDGRTGGDNNATINVWSEYLYEPSFNYVKNVNVKQGNFAPKSLNNGVNVSVAENSIFDISKISDFEVNDFLGGGILVLDKSSSLKINGNFTGSTEFRTSGMVTGSGYMEYDKMYFDTSNATGDGQFIISNPYPTQSTITITKDTDGKWYTSTAPDLGDAVLSKFEIENKDISVSKDDINGRGYDIPVTLEFDETSSFPDLGMVPLSYSISYNGKESDIVTSDPIEEEDGYYEGNFQDLNMNFTPIDDVITISKYSQKYTFTGDIATGVYYITIIAPLKNGSATETIRLAVKGDDVAPEIVTPVISDLFVYGTKLSDIELSGGWKWSNENLVADVGSNAYEAYIDVDDATYDYSSVDGYNSELHRVERKVTVQVNKAKPTINAVVENVTKVNNGYEVEVVAIVRGVSNGENPSGDVNFKTETLDFGNITLNKETARHTFDITDENYDVIVSYAGDVNYTEATTTVTAKGSKIAPELTTPSIDASYKYGIKLSDIELSGDWKWQEENTVAEVGSHEYVAYIEVDDVLYDYSDVEGYNSELHRVERKVTIQTNKANPTIKIDTGKIVANETGYEVELNITVTGVSNAENPTGIVTIKNSTNEFGNIELTNGIAKYTLNVLDGNYEIYAIYNGDSNYNGVNSEVCKGQIEQLTTEKIDDDNTNVVFANFGENYIENAIMIIAFYDNGVLKKLVQNEFSLEVGKCYMTTVDKQGVDCDSIKIFVWDSLLGGKPLCNGKEIN